MSVLQSTTVWLLFCAFLGAACSLAFFLRGREEDKLQNENLKPGRQTSLIEPLTLPVIMLTLTALLLLAGDEVRTARVLSSFSLLFVNISIYYLLVLLLLPLLRKRISARACADLWLVPALTYVLFQLIVNFQPTPLFVFTLPRSALNVAMRIWALGFLGVVVWQLASHFRYRHFILAGSTRISKGDILAIWRAELLHHGVKANIPIIVSDKVTTPLTIGLFHRTMRLVLPSTNYSERELKFIFRHELRHILRADTRTKLFVGLCTAICWFNPLGWIARKKVSDDLELSCDEAVLESADEGERREYAELLLKTAGDSRGFTTCLSASASTFRYRLKSVVKPAYKYPGSLVVGFALFVLAMSVGSFALADAPAPAQELIFDALPEAESVALYSNNWNGFATGDKKLDGDKAAALTEYLASLDIKEVYTAILPARDVQQLTVRFESMSGGRIERTTLTLADEFIQTISTDYSSGKLRFREMSYLPAEEIDWAFLATVFE